MLADTDLLLSPAGRERITTGYRMIDATDTEAQPLKKELQRFGRRQPVCRALFGAQHGTYDAVRPRLPRSWAVRSEL